MVQSTATMRLYLYCCLLLVMQGLTVVLGTASNGAPVYVNAIKVAKPAAVVEPTVAAAAADRVTQTVYGFLDFTTTIGNTVMVFSPQSAPPPGGTPKVEQTTQAATNTVIQTKPSKDEKPTQKPPVEIIKPSKPIVKPTTEKKATAPAETKKTSTEIVKSQPQVQAKPQKVEVVSSFVEVRAETRPPVVVSRVEVIEGSESQSIASSKVEVFVNNNGGATITPHLPKASAVFSSVVEVRSSNDVSDVPVVLNNIGEPEYNFLSRQPAQIVDESYRVIDLKRPPGGSSGNIAPQTNKQQSKHRAAESGKNRANAGQQAQVHPTGLVTRLGGTVVKEGVTTVHETSVIGTYINGKYAQVLQSTSKIFQEGSKPKPTPSNSGQPRILKTAAPHVHQQGGKHTKVNAEPTSTGPVGALPLEALFQGNQAEQTRSPRKPALPSSSGGSFKNRLRPGKNQTPSNAFPKHSQDEDIEKQIDIAPSSTKKAGKRTSQGRYPNRFGRTQHPELATVSVFSEQAASSTTRRPKSGRYGKSNNNQQQQSPISESAPSSSSRRTYKPKPTPAEQQASNAADATSLYKFKLNRAPGRWQYKTTPKPRVTIRKQQADEPHPVTPSTHPSSDGVANGAAAISEPQVGVEAEDLESSSSQHGSRLSDDIDDTADNAIDDPFPVQTVKIAISTPADFQNVYFEIATIKSPYTFQVGTLKNTRYVTVTSTFEKFLVEPTASPDITPTTVGSSEPLTEDILATATVAPEVGQQHLARHLAETGIATLPTLLLPSDVETPPLETMTETFSTAERVLKTYVLPIVKNATISKLTLVQTYDVTRLVTATKTLPPEEAYHFVPSRALTEFDSGLDEAGSELHLALDFSEDEEENDRRDSVKVLPADLDLANIGSDFNLSDVEKTNNISHKKPIGPPKIPPTTTAAPKPAEPQLTPEQLQQLALLRFLNPAAAAAPQLITSSKPVIRLETVYESHVIPLFDGSNTLFSTISRPVATVTKTDYEVVTSTAALPPPPVLPPNPLFPQIPNQQFQITSTPIVTQAIVTATDSKVLKLTFGAKTAYTTLYSTRVVPTLVTTYLTASVPFVQPTAAAFPGYFPAPYPGFPFVG